MELSVETWGIIRAGTMRTSSKQAMVAWKAAARKNGPAGGTRRQLLPIALSVEPLMAEVFLSSASLPLVALKHVRIVAHPAE